MSSFCNHIASSFWTFSGFLVLVGAAIGVLIVRSPVQSLDYAADHSLIESANVPACSRIGAIWPVFSAYLKAV
jgi:hypothetical protein